MKTSLLIVFLMVSGGLVFSQTNSNSAPAQPAQSDVNKTLSDYLEKVDKTIDATLAATLAGLALAAAAFLSPAADAAKKIYDSVDAKHKRYYKEKFDNIQKAIWRLGMGTFAFLVVLVDKLDIEPATAWSNSPDILCRINFVAADGAMTAGVVCLVLGVYSILPSPERSAD